MSTSHIHPPPITLQDLQAFQAKHFPDPNLAAQTLLATQLTPQAHTNTTNTTTTTTASAAAPADPSYYDAEDEEDGLGYYSDGVKRTLTDEQIQIFRHSEIHALLRQRELREEAERERRAEEEEEDQKARRAERGVERRDDDDDDDGGEVRGGGEVMLDVAVPTQVDAAGAGAGTADASEKPEPPRHGKSSAGKKRPRDDGDLHMDYGDAAGGQQQQQQRQPRHSSSGAAGRCGSSSDPYADPSRRAALFTGRKIISYDD
ncbi:hypothetical protein BO86DRAFT_410392 [Aspergillus japonicus CBS 114.51]|uniref:Uncharacterized protein n=1 Tax=Aspergillus japonicus CBS 114.51 TaxID=1448312 RepID=A0A8T8WYZ4_ASPJA|nr:hypothetical protein BO86DRAFT_410392 [Aspergillus japonicus CBS 114.51]RAH81073.1 hypothetical protein BO86DRAFT_410392 [Aspergillus japonicus CBS 114.51]